MEVDKSVIKELKYLNMNPKRLFRYLTLMEELPYIRNCELTLERNGNPIIRAEYTGRKKIGEAGKKTKRTIRIGPRKNVSKIFSGMPEMKGFYFCEAHPDLYDPNLCYGTLLIDEKVNISVQLRKINK